MKARFLLARTGFSLDVDLDLPERGVTALFGPSGSGKTTLLRCLAGLERAPRGRFEIAGEVWQDEARNFFLPTHRRPLGLVFQEASLFPHLSARANLRYGMQRARVADEGFFDDLVDLLGLRPLLARMPEGLSGGEKQRVAIARALLTRPRLLLMDEPLSGLDAQKKQDILPYLETLHAALDIPVLYVSHAPDEVARLADHLVLIDAGRIRASGPLSETLARLDLDAAFGDDQGVVFTARVAERADDGLVRLDIPGGALFVASNAALDSRLRCRIHARDVSIALSAHRDTSILNLLAATVVACAPAETPGHMLVQLQLPEAGSLLLARITERSGKALRLVPGLPVIAQVKAVALL